MKRPTPPRPPADAEQRRIDERYGLEPVIEPGSGAAELANFVTVACPYCGESYGTPVDLTLGSFSYVEDCQICCQPIELAFEVDDDGALASMNARRLD